MRLWGKSEWLLNGPLFRKTLFIIHDVKDRRNAREGAAS
jgi:hypothetical protein